MAGASGATTSCSRRRCASGSRIPAARGSRPTASARPATPACGGSASTSSTSTSSTRPIRTCRWRTRSRRSTGSCRPARCARSAPRTSRPGCSRGRSRCRTATAGRRSSSLQPQYSLVERSIEIEMLPFCRAAGLGVIPWGPLGAGFLTGRYSRDEPPPAGSRMAEARDDLEEAPARRAIERNFRAVDEARAIAEAKGATIAAGRARVAAGRRGRDVADRRPAHVRAARGPARRGRRRPRREEHERLGAHTEPPEVLSGPHAAASRAGSTWSCRCGDEPVVRRHGRRSRCRPGDRGAARRGRRRGRRRHRGDRWAWQRDPGDRGRRGR